MHGIALVWAQFIAVDLKMSCLPPKQDRQVTSMQPPKHEVTEAAKWNPLPTQASKFHMGDHASSQGSGS